MGRAPCCDKANVKKGPWSPEEDAKLKAYIEEYGTGGNWIALPQKIGLKRCGKSCRLRWLNYLRPNIKHGGFSEEEDNIICSLYISIGSRWSIIAAQLPGRTDNDIKNYWNTRLKKKLLGRRKQSNANGLSSTGQDPNDVNARDDTQLSQGLSSSALERLQLHMQLQTLQNPFSFYNNPALWPKLHPYQEKMIQSLQSLNGSHDSFMQHVLSSSQLGHEQRGDHCYQQSTASLSFPHDHPQIRNPKAAPELNNSLNGISSSHSPVPINSQSNLMDSTTIVPKVNGTEQPDHVPTQQVSNFQAELENFLNTKLAGFTAQEEQITQFDSFNSMNGSKDNLVWWSNEFDSKSASSNSWDSTPVLQPEGMFQDFELGYNM